MANLIVTSAYSNSNTLYSNGNNRNLNYKQEETIPLMNIPVAQLVGTDSFSIRGKSKAQDDNSNIPSRLMPTKQDTERYQTKQGIKVIKNNNGSATYKLPPQYWGDDGLLLGTQITEFTVKSGKITKMKITYYYCSDYDYDNIGRVNAENLKVDNNSKEVFVWEKGKDNIPLSKITKCTAKMLQEGSFAEIMKNNPEGYGMVWSGQL